MGLSQLLFSFGLSAEVCCGSTVHDFPCGQGGRVVRRRYWPVRAGGQAESPRRVRDLEAEP
jgi:hypothetical protein